MQKAGAHKGDGGERERSMSAGIYMLYAYTYKSQPGALVGKKGMSTGEQHSPVLVGQYGLCVAPSGPLATLPYQLYSPRYQSLVLCL